MVFLKSVSLRNKLYCTNINIQPILKLNLAKTSKDKIYTVVHRSQFDKKQNTLKRDLNKKN